MREGFTIRPVEAEFETSVTLRSRVATPRALPGVPLVLALHGWGMSERSFARWLAPAFEAPALSWWLPRGVLPCEVRSRRVGYGWYVFDGDQEALRASMDEARCYLAALVAIARRALRPSSITLLGFSQGAYLASYAALARPDLFDAVVCCCGRPKCEFVPDLAAARRLRFLVQTGLRDASVPRDLVARGVSPLREAGLPVDERSYDAEHRLTPEMARDAAEWIR